ncbi:MAG: leucine--tRNA ligase [bacterium]|nr:leucine--tRNA ligase [bacterium]
MKRYNPKTIEPKWQKIWDKNQTYKADLKSLKPKYIGMSMFNYPSGAGIHIGHAMNYTISDVMARVKRQQGFESYHPVGWDAFGLPAENYAIKAGVSPQASMAEIIPRYHKQYKAMGWSNDWSKEISTHLPKYYKWTQWIFSQMYRNGLAYQDSRMQWWCEKCQTVLANEQVDSDGKCWRHDSPDDAVVGKKEVKQWFFKITDYADEILEATDDLDWTESVKGMQKSWIGKSVGAEIDFKVDGSNEKIKVFTTRADTIFSCAFLVLAPEHELVEQITADDELPKVKEYIRGSIKKTEVERQADKEKSGVFTGAYAVNPANDEKIPIWVGDFVLAGYGTGAVFGDIHDERDFEFLNKFNIPAKPTVIPEDEKEAKRVIAKEYAFTGEGILIDSGQFTGMRSENAREKITSWLAKRGLAEEKTNFKMRDWSVSRQRYWGAPIPIIHCEKCGPELVEDKDLPVVLPELEDFQPSGDGRSALARATDWLKTKCPKCGGVGERETDTLDTYICSSWYMFRYLDPRNNEKIFDGEIVNKWMPIDFYNGGDHATAHMIYARFVTRFFHKLGLVDNPEPFKKFLFNGKVTASDGKNFSKSKGNGVDPLEIINSGYGADALRTYLMFAAPLDLWVRWDPQGVPGTYRFLSRLWTLTKEFMESDKKPGENITVLGSIHRTIKKVTEDLEHQKYNTAIAAMMQCTNDFYLEKAKNGFVGSDSWQFALESLAQLVAPFSPHIAEELWQEFGYEDSVHVDHWPAWDEDLIKEQLITLAVQINGKVRAEVLVDIDITEEAAIETAKNDDKVAKILEGKKIKKTVYVPGRLVSLVI